jgi:hypothetical protein
MRTVIYLNRSNDLFHLMLMKANEDSEQTRRLDSRFARSFEQARKAVDYWRTEYGVSVSKSAEAQAEAPYRACVQASTYSTKPGNWRPTCRLTGKQRSLMPPVRE